MSVDGSAYNTWELEEKVESLAVNETAQVHKYVSVNCCYGGCPYRSRNLAMPQTELCLAQ